jgi:hypothetical protein
MRLRLRFIGAHAVLAKSFVDELYLSPKMRIFGMSLLDNLATPIKSL